MLADPELAERQKQVLLEIYESFRRETAGNAQAGAGGEAADPGPGPHAEGTGPEGTGLESVGADGAGGASPGMGSTGGGRGLTGPTRRAPARKHRRTTREGLPVRPGE